MVNFFDRFWVSQIAPPSPTILLILVFIDITFIFIMYSAYKSIIYQINNSMRGISEDAKVRIPKNLHSSIKSIFIGSGLLIGSSIISRLSFFLDVNCPTSPVYENIQDCYLFIGQEDVPAAIGLIMIMIGIYNFYNELTRDVSSPRIDYKNFIIVVILFPSIVVGSIFVPRLSLYFEMLITVFLASGYLSFVMYFLIKIYKDKSIKNQNPLLKLRKNILRNMAFGNIIFPLTIGTIFFPRENRFLTQEPWVELYLTGLSFYGLLITASVLAIIFTPQTLLDYYGIDKQDMIKFGDIRFDNPLNKLTVAGQGITFEEQDDIENKKYVLAYEEHERLICEAIKSNFSGDVIEFSKRIEVTLEQITLPNVDIMYFSAYNSRSREYQLRRINEKFAKKFSYDGGKIVYQDIHNFVAEDYVYALIIISPSEYNPNNNMWIINFTPEISYQITSFFQTYHNYLKGIPTHQRLQEDPISSIVLRFKRVNNKIMEIPNISPNRPIPDPKYMVFL